MKIFHHNDQDGRAAAYAASYFAKKTFPKTPVQFIEMTYTKAFPFDSIEQNELVFIVDFSIDDRTSFLSRKGINFIESRVSSDHYKHYKEYVADNGLNALLKGLPLKEIENHYFALNGVVLKVLQKIK